MEHGKFCKDGFAPLHNDFLNGMVVRGTLSCYLTCKSVEA